MMIAFFILLWLTAAGALKSSPLPEEDKSTAAGALKSSPLPEEDKRPLQQWSAVMSHDAATGEMDQDRDGIIQGVEDAYTITQSSPLVKQLECGARALDYRPFLLNDGTIVAHHGSHVVKKPLADSLADITSFLQPTQELVLLYLSHFSGETSGCKSTKEENCQETKEAVVKLLQSRNIPFVQNCDDLVGLTVQAAYSKGKLFAVLDCIEEQYDPSITCYGLDYTCYGRNQDKAWSKLEAYMDKLSAVVNPATNPFLRMLQAHWQSSTESVPLGLAHGSSVLKDEQKAGVNIWLAEQIKAKRFVEGLNLIELDNVCDNGPAVFAAMQQPN